jgi:hypothetical protein
MSRSCKSPRAVLRVAYGTAIEALPAYAHRFSPKKFTQPQLFACLVLKEFSNTDYRGVVALLVDSPELRRQIALAVVPHFTTLQKAARRLLRVPPARRLLAATLRRARRTGRLRRRVRLAALDGTGLESRHISAYFLRRREKPRKNGQQRHSRFPKVGIMCDCASHLILAAIPERGPASDSTHYRRALREGVRSVTIGTLVADAGYDSEESHRFARHVLGIRTIIPDKIGRPTTKPPTGRYRRLMRTRFDRATYRQRWQVETVHSMMKRNLGSALRARAYHSQGREIVLRAITHNIMILKREVFYRAKSLH